MLGDDSRPPPMATCWSCCSRLSATVSSCSPARPPPAMGLLRGAGGVAWWKVTDGVVPWCCCCCMCSGGGGGMSECCCCCAWKRIMACWPVGSPPAALVLPRKWLPSMESVRLGKPEPRLMPPMPSSTSRPGLSSSSTSPTKFSTVLLPWPVCFRYTTACHQHRHEAGIARSAVSAWRGAVGAKP